MTAGALKGGGAVAISAGIIGGLMALKLNTSVHSAADYRYGTFVPSSDTINIGLLQNQHLAFLAAAFLFLAGVILFCSGVIVEAITTSATDVDGDTIVDKVAPQQHPRTAPSASDKKKDETALIVLGSVGALVALLIAIIVFNGTSISPGDLATPPANDAAALADNLLTQADNLDAMADATVEPSQ